MSVTRPIATWLNQQRGSIGTRMVAMFLGLLVVVQLASFVALQDSLANHARNALPERLEVGQRVMRSLLNQRSQKLIDGARLLAADYGFRAALATDDGETISSVLSNHGARIGAGETLLLGPNFQMRASGGDIASIAPWIARLSTQATAQGAASVIALVNGLPHQLVMVPVKAPQTIGWVVMGFAIDAQLARDMRSLSALDVTLLARTSGGTWASTVSTLPPAQAQRVAVAGTFTDADTPSATIDSIKVDGTELGYRVRSLTQASAGADNGAVLSVVSVSIDDATRLARDVQIALAAITSVAFLIALTGSLLSARQLILPLQNLTGAAQRLGDGDYQTPIPTTTRRDEIGQLTRVFEQMRRNVADKQAEILKLAYWDPLTGLPNRTQFRDAVQQALTCAQNAPHSAAVSVIMLDLDRLKHVNDVLGYHFGDLLLTRMAERLVAQSRDSDLVARLGGDEFAVLLTGTDAELATAVARRMEAAFAQPLTLEEHTVDMGAGIGIATWPQHAADVDTLLSRAEIAMYAAKRRSHEPVLYSPAIDAGSAQTLSLLTDLRAALADSQLRLFVQPKLSLAGADVVGAEALMRWQHPLRGLMQPAQFIPFAEQTGFIRTLTLWMFEEAARHWNQLQTGGVRVALSVNLSTRDLLDLELPQKFEALLGKHGVPASALCLEITESAIMDDPQRAQVTLDRLNELGFRLSIDDFGTGYSSLAYLKRLPVDELKIDKSFVMNMTRDANDAQIVRSTIDMAHNLGLSVVAEGVENASAWEMLRELRCDQAQGFLIAKPMPAADFAPWVARWSAEHKLGDLPATPPSPSRPLLH